MVTTTADLTVTPTAEGITILYRSSNVEYAYTGYYSDYDSRAITTVVLPLAVLGICQAYALIHSGEAFEIFIDVQQYDLFGRFSAQREHLI